MRLPGLSFVAVTVIAACRPAAGLGEIPADSKAAVKNSVERAVGYLQEKGLDWKESRQCASCHHVPLMTWAMHAAKRHDIGIDEELLKEATDWHFAEGDPAKIIQTATESEENPYPNPLSLNTAYMLLSESNGPNDMARRPMVAKFLKHVVEVQQADGSWREFQGRPPIFASQMELTLFLINTLSWPEQPEELKGLVVDSRRKAMNWAMTQGDDLEIQEVALRLWMLKTAGRPQAEIDAAVQKLIARQQADGGWSQNAQRASDAYATGQVLYALQEAALSPQHDAMRRGVEFLLTSQSQDGSWAMISRPMRPALQFAVSAVTFKHEVIGFEPLTANAAAGARNTGPISFTATAWATVALCRTLP